MNRTIYPKTNLQGSFTVPGDKSISHRSIMLGALANGTTEITGFLQGADCLSTISCFQKLGIPIQIEKDKIFVQGKGLHGLTAPTETLDVGNSGTTLRLMTGLLSAQPFTSYITGDASIQRRPMDRVINPLSKMGATIDGQKKEGKITAPLTIHGQPLTGITYTLPVASAQVKSALILAGLYARGNTVIIEPEATRNHTEIMLNYLGAQIETKENQIICHPIQELYAKPISVPGDISSAAYFLVAAAITPHSHIIIKNVGINPTRIGIITALEEMGASITLQNKKIGFGESTADIEVYAGTLHGITIGGSLIPKLIDEIPVLAVAACYAQGTTVIQNAEELKVKESNRIRTMVTELKKLGADIMETNDGMIIHGGAPLHGGLVESYEDHRVAMSLAIAATLGQEPVTIQNSQCVDISFPDFYTLLQKLS